MISIDRYKSDHSSMPTESKLKIASYLPVSIFFT